MSLKQLAISSVFVFLLYSFTYNNQPCEKRKTIPNVFFPTDEIRFYENCDDTTTCYFKQLENNILVQEGNIINNLREGVWKGYSNETGKLEHETHYFHDQPMKVNFFEVNTIITDTYVNDSIQFRSVSTTDGVVIQSGFCNRWKRFGVWQEFDSITNMNSIGEYFQNVCDTITIYSVHPPYITYDSVSCKSLKEKEWLYFDSTNKFVRKEIYNKGELIK